MKVLIAGAAGQLGRALQKTAPGGAVVVAPPESDLDILDGGRVAAAVAAARPDLVINAAAYTAVDSAEGDEEKAFLVNAAAAGALAAAAAGSGARFVHVSTDFIFDGENAAPYRTDSTPGPQNAYGRSKLAGERLVQAAHPSPLVVRTAWVYAAEGRNFVRTMLKLMHERPQVRVVADQIGTPTHARSLARAIWALDSAAATGIRHWTDAGVASWYDFAVAIHEEALALGILSRPVQVVPIPASEYPTPARRPRMSVLDKSSSWEVTGPANHWREELRLALRELKERD